MYSLRKVQWRRHTCVRMRRPAEPGLRRDAGRVRDAHRDRVRRDPPDLRPRHPARVPPGACHVGFNGVLES